MIAIICAMENELENYKLKLEEQVTHQHNKQTFFSGKINNNSVVLVKCGIGKVNAAITTVTLISVYKPTLIINTGIAGGLSPLKTKDLFIAEKFTYGDFDLAVYGYKKGQVPGYDQFFKASKSHVDTYVKYLKEEQIKHVKGTIVTQDKFITNITQVDLQEKNIATDMEGAAIAHVCKLHEIPFMAIRIISDVVGELSQITNYNEFENEAAKLSSKSTYKFLKNNIVK